jgi:hypothetical protein
MKYIIRKILERNGDFEYRTDYLFQTDGNPEQYAEKMAMEWYGGDEDAYDEDQEGYWADSALIFNNGHQEITEAEFDVMKKYITVLNK